MRVNRTNKNHPNPTDQTCPTAQGTEKTKPTAPNELTNLATSSSSSVFHVVAILTLSCCFLFFPSLSLSLLLYLLTPSQQQLQNFVQQEQQVRANAPNLDVYPFLHTSPRHSPLVLFFFLLVAFHCCCTECGHPTSHQSSLRTMF